MDSFDPNNVKTRSGWPLLSWELRKRLTKK